MRSTPTAGRLRIGLFGRRNAGKSSLANALAGQDVAIVSGVPGTTTDPVAKTMEILPIGPVVIVDTAGFDDVGDLGRLRVERTRKVLRQTDVAVLVLDAALEAGPEEEELLQELAGGSIPAGSRLPIVVAVNKADLDGDGAARAAGWAEDRGLDPVVVSTATGQGLSRLKQAIIAAAPADWEGAPIVGGLVGRGDLVVLVVPVDLEAPKGRLILPQVQTLRDILDHGATALVCKESELASVVGRLGSPGPCLVVTDSQAFEPVARLVPPEVPLTSFSILFARRKGDLPALVQGAMAADRLRPRDRVLVAEACSHHPIGDDIGRLKIPRWLERRVGGPLDFTHCAGGDFPSDLADYKLVVHCGGCMINRKEMLYRLSAAQSAGVPIVNYGVLIAHLHGILGRALAPLGLGRGESEAAAATSRPAART